MARTQQACARPGVALSPTAMAPRRTAAGDRHRCRLRQIRNGSGAGSYFGCACRSKREITDAASRITMNVVITTTRSIVTSSQLPAS